MKGVFFGYEVRESCPACGTPRIGADFDDNYHIRAGILHPEEKPTCTFAGWEKNSWGEWEAYFHDASGLLKSVTRQDTPRSCPACGGPVEEVTSVKTLYLSHGRTQKRNIQMWVCVAAQGKPAWVEELPGCPQCGSSYSW